MRRGRRKAASLFTSLRSTIDRAVKIERNSTIAGVPAFVLRKALRDRIGHEWHGARLADEVGASAAAQLLRALVEEGLVERLDGSDLWRATIKGNALAQAKARRISRAAAQRQLDAFLARVQELKADPHHLWRVHRVSLFGSFADPTAADVGDVDLVVELATKEPNWARHVKLEEAYRQRESKNGRRFPSFIDELISPRQDPIRFLKSRSAVLSIHDSTEFEAFPRSIFSVIYEDPIDEPGRTHPGDMSSP